MSPNPLRVLSARRPRYRSILKQRRSRKGTGAVLGVILMIVIVAGIALRWVSGNEKPGSNEHGYVRAQKITASSDPVYETTVLQASPERSRVARA